MERGDLKIDAAGRQRETDSLKGCQTLLALMYHFHFHWSQRILKGMIKMEKHCSTEGGGGHLECCAAAVEDGVGDKDDAEDAAEEENLCPSFLTSAHQDHSYYLTPLKNWQGPVVFHTYCALPRTNVQGHTTQLHPLCALWPLQDFPDFVWAERLGVGVQEPEVGPVLYLDIAVPFPALVCAVSLPPLAALAVSPTEPAGGACDVGGHGAGTCALVVLDPALW